MRIVNVLFGRPAAVIASLALAALFLSAGRATLPTRAQPPSLGYRVPETAAAVAEASGLPVFLLQANHATLRSGTARIGAGGAVDITLYDPSDPRLIHGSEAVLFNTDLRVLWLLATDEERTALREGLQTVGRGLRDAVEAVLRSPEFTGAYRDELKDIGRQIIEDAWRAPATRAAYDEMIRSTEPLLHEAAGREVKAIVVKQIEPMVWNLISANMGVALDVFHSQPWDFSPVEHAMDAIQREVRERNVLQRALQQVLDSWQAKAFLQTVAGAVMDAAADNPRLRDVAGRMVNDPRLGTYFAPVSGPVADLARLAPNILFGVQPGVDLNALAAFTFQGFISGRPGQFIVLMSPQQREDILRLDSFSPRPLLHSVLP
ncbi:hypothetical protein M2352_005036 [Azospirillum fermentarium]|uniref:hypothetical protein n=1 Tax=Azospirillum fermentarium TaxID=1233114 RepID=UPI00222757C4|nr:hypothetical protein [Azospirillum fermentarium]MCW2249376.1 hypothetical protein [Azospirillum fermentarium]